MITIIQQIFRINFAKYRNSKGRKIWTTNATLTVNPINIYKKLKLFKNRFINHLLWTKTAFICVKTIFRISFAVIYRINELEAINQKRGKKDQNQRSFAFVSGCDEISLSVTFVTLSVLNTNSVKLKLN